VRKLPHFEKAAEQYGENRNVVFLAISIDDNRPAVRPFIEKSGLKIVAAYDDDAADACKVKNIPATLFIDRDGVIQFREEGFGGEGSDYIERFAWRVDALLKEK